MKMSDEVADILVKEHTFTGVTLVSAMTAFAATCVEQYRDDPNFTREAFAKKALENSKGIMFLFEEAEKMNKPAMDQIRSFDEIINNLK